MNEERNRRKVRQGVVVSATNDKTIVVQIEERKRNNPELFRSPRESSWSCITD